MKNSTQKSYDDVQSMVSEIDVNSLLNKPETKERNKETYTTAVML